MSRRSQQKVVADLNRVFNDRRIPLEALQHLLANGHRLIRSQYDDGSGGKCIFGLLSEPFSPDLQINSRDTLVAFYGGDPTAPRYRIPRAIVRLWDGLPCDPFVVERYGPDAPPLTKQLLLRVLRQAIRRRKAELRRLNRSALCANARAGDLIVPITKPSGRDVPLGRRCAADAVVV